MPSTPIIPEETVLDACRELGRPTAEQIRHQLSQFGIAASLGQVIDLLLRTEISGAVERVMDDRFDRLQPLTSVGWLVKNSANKAPTVTNHSGTSKEDQSYVKSCKLVLSQPSFAFSAIDNLRKETSSLELREAIEFVLLRAKNSLRVMSHNYDIMFVDMLSRHTDKIKSLATLRIVADEDRDNTRTALTKIAGLFPKSETKYFYRSHSNLRSKLGGVHAKLIIADYDMALLGSFNLSSAHTMLNFDLGVLVEGSVVHELAKIYDTIWRMG